MLKITKRKEKKRKEKLVPRLAITTRDCCVAREGAKRRRMGLVEGDPFPIRVSPQAFNHPIKRIFTYVN